MAPEIVGVLHEEDELIEELKKEIKSDIITFNLTVDDVSTLTLNGLLFKRHKTNGMFRLSLLCSHDSVSGSG